MQTIVSGQLLPQVDTLIDVVYIEDTEMEAYLFRLGMKKYNVNVLHLPDASKDSLGQLNEEPYVNARALFLDLYISGLNGVQIARGLRESGDDRPFFLITAGDNPDPKALEMLNMHFLRKPYNFEIIAGLIKDSA